MLDLVNQQERGEVEEVLGGLQEDETGRIVSARAAKLDLLTTTNITEALAGGAAPGHSSPVTPATLRWDYSSSSSVKCKLSGSSWHCGLHC